MGTVASAGVEFSGLMRCRHAQVPPPRSAFASSASHQRSLPSRCGSIYTTGCYREAEERLAERGVQVWFA
jgi:hypothetical protein